MDGVKALLKKKNNELINVPQVVLVGFNLMMFLLISHLRMLLDNSLSSILRTTCNGERRVLVTKWVGKAWIEVGSSHDMVVRSF